MFPAKAERAGERDAQEGQLGSEERRGKKDGETGEEDAARDGGADARGGGAKDERGGGGGGVKRTNKTGEGGTPRPRIPMQ